MTRKQAPDDLDRYIAERARTSPKLPAMVARERLGGSCSGCWPSGAWRWG